MNYYALNFVIFSEYFWQLIRYKRKTGLQDAEDISGHVVVITGANSGLGKASAMEFARRGAKIVMGCRNLDKGRSALQEIKETTNNVNVHLIQVDLSDRTSVEQFAEQVKREYPEIKVLVNNAGMMDFNKNEQKTEDGGNLSMRVNYLGHFLLTNLLLENLKRGSPSRIINVVSSLVMLQKLNLEDIEMKNPPLPWYRRPFETNMGYNNSKYSLVLFARELGRQLEGTGVTAFSICPGIFKTTIVQERHKYLQWLYNKLVVIILGLNPDQAVEEYISHIVLSPDVLKSSGKMFRFRKPLESVNRRIDDTTTEKLWKNTSSILMMENV